MAKITITAGDGVLKRFGNQVGALGSTKTHRALARAVNRVTNTVHGRVIRAIRKQSGIPTAIIRKQVKKRLASPDASHGGNLEGVIWATGKPLSLKYFGARQFSWGVRTKENGGLKRYPGFFINGGTWRSGKPIAYGHVFKNTHGYNAKSKRNNAIEMQYGSSVPEELVRDQSERVFHETVEEMLTRRVAHELSRLLPM